MRVYSHDQWYETFLALRGLNQLLGFLFHFVLKYLEHLVIGNLFFEFILYAFIEFKKI